MRSKGKKNTKKRSRQAVDLSMIYKDNMVAKFINNIMKDGKKDKAAKIFLDCMNIVQKKTSSDPIKIFYEAIDTVKPCVELRSHRLGGSNYQVPCPVREDRQNILARRWIIDSAIKRPDYEMSVSLANELIDSVQKKSMSFKKREDLHKMAEANKAFAHLAQRIIK